MRIFRLELKRVLKSRLTWTLLALALILSVLLAWLPTTYCYSSYTDEVGNEVNLADTAGQAEISLLLDKLKKAHKFTKQEQSWISRMEKYLMEESVLNVSVFDEDGRFKAQGGFAKINKVFGNRLESIVLELNEYLYDDGGKIA